MPWFPRLPNLLTAARMALTVPVVLAIVARNYWGALVLLAVAGVTDGVDGYLARRFSWSSELGARLDPLADKLMLGAVYVALGITGALPLWLVILVFGRDLAILLFIACALAFTRLRHFPPTFWGKLSTVLQIAAALVALGARAGILPEVLTTLAIALAAAATSWSWVHYGWRGFRMLREAQAQAQVRS